MGLCLFKGCCQVEAADYCLFLSSVVGWSSLDCCLHSVGAKASFENRSFVLTVVMVVRCRDCFLAGVEGEDMRCCFRFVVVRVGYWHGCWCVLLVVTLKEGNWGCLCFVRRHRTWL